MSDSIHLVTRCDIFHSDSAVSAKQSQFQTTLFYLPTYFNIYIVFFEIIKIMPTFPTMFCKKMFKHTAKIPN